MKDTVAWRVAGKAALKALAEENGVEIMTVDHRWKAESCVGTRTIFVPKRWFRPIDCFISMHELGHIADEAAVEYVGSTDVNKALFAEVAAWAWGFLHTPKEVVDESDETDWSLVGSALASHLAFHCAM